MRHSEVASAILVCAFIPAALAILAGVGLFTRPFWSDEVLSWLIASDPSFAHGMAALAGGVDTNAPLLHAMLHVVGNLLGHEPIVYRIVSAAAMSLAMSGLYLTLRRVASASVAASAGLLLWSLPIVFAHTTEARFYSLELAAAVWANLALERRNDRPTAANALLLAVASVGLCSAHYFGIVALGAIVGSRILRDSFARDAAWWRRSLDTIYPTAAGVATAMCFWPLIHTQRQTMASVGGTWVPDEFFVNVRCAIESIVSPVAFVIVAACAVLAIRRQRISAAILLHVGLIAATALYIAGIVAFDRLVQPVIVPRYFVVALPGIAALAAAVLMAAPRWATWATLVFAALLLGGDAIDARTKLADPTPRSALGIVRSIERFHDDTPIVSDWLGYALPVIRQWPDARERVTYFPDERIRDAQLAQSIPYERRMAECVERFYGMPGRSSVASIAKQDHFVLLTEFAGTIDGRFPGWRSRAIGPITFEMTREAGATATDASVEDAAVDRD